MTYPLIPAIAIGTLLSIAACAPRQKEASSAPAAASATTTTYRCESGVSILATYPNTESATIRYKDSTYAMRIAISADGARYVGGGLQWWTKGAGAGSHGMLSESKDGNPGGKSLETCTAEGA
jgi:membrane-bound inhibitor of C-type lysozyme